MSALTRREFLKQAALTGLALSLPSWPATAWSLPKKNGGNPLPLPGPSGLYGLLAPEGRLTLTAAPAQGALPGRPGSPFLAYHATQNGAVFLNPILRLQRGQDFQAEMVNSLTEPTIIHWHGVDTDWRQSGHPLLAVPPGERFPIRFPVTNRAGTYWYHPHPHGLTGPQTYFGLASFFLVEDEEERALAQDLGLELGLTDIPLLLQDKRFDAKGHLVYAPSAEEKFMGSLGDTVLVNGLDQAVLTASRRLYRLRLLNGSTARIFHLELTSQGQPQPMVLMGTDAGLIGSPVSMERFFLAPGERVEILVDLSRAKEGQEFVLANRPFDPMHQEMDMAGHGGGHGEAKSPAAAGHAGMGGMDMSGMKMDGMDMPGMKMPNMKKDDMKMGGHDNAQGDAHGDAHGQGGLAEGAAYPLLRIQVGPGPAQVRKIPAIFSSLPDLSAIQTGSLANTRDFTLAARGQEWTISGLTYAMHETPVRVEAREPERWRFVNQVRSMPHPMHVHGYPFRVLSRQGSPAQVKGLAVNPSGILPTDLGFKDTVLVWPGETVSLALDFSTPDYAGEQTFLMHCHNLEHEDQGMMLNFTVAEGTKS